MVWWKKIRSKDIKKNEISRKSSFVCLKLWSPGRKSHKISSKCLNNQVLSLFSCFKRSSRLIRAENKWKGRAERTKIPIFCEIIQGSALNFNWLPIFFLKFLCTFNKFIQILLEKNSPTQKFKIRHQKCKRNIHKFNICDSPSCKCESLKFHSNNSFHIFVLINFAIWHAL